MHFAVRSQRRPQFEGSATNGKDCMDPRNTLHALLVEHAGARANAVALRAPGRPPLRYGELSEQILRIGGWLAAAGVEPGDRVAIALPNGPELAVAVLGV